MMTINLSLIQQERIMKLRYPKIKSWYRTLADGKYLCATMKLQPAPIFEAYEVMFAYRLGQRPLVYILEPESVKEAHGMATPHLNGDRTLCLYDEGGGQWTAADAIANTTIPWTLRWLFHYENWLSTTVWLGDTESPEPKTEDESIDLKLLEKLE